MTDVITALNCIYVAEGTACEWAESLTLKKDLHVRLAIGRTEKNVKNKRKDFKPDEEKSFSFSFFCSIGGKIKFAPGKQEHCHPPSYTQTHLLNKVFKVLSAVVFGVLRSDGISR